MAELLLELFSEEIPARMQVTAADELKRHTATRLQELNIDFTTIRSFVTPRRLTLVAEGIPLMQPDSSIEKKGPRIDAPQAAIDGFLKSVSMTLDQLDVQKTEKGEFYISTVFQKGQPTSELLTKAIEEVIAGFRWPKSMKWGSSSIRWVRPLQNILCIFDGAILPVTFGHLQANNSSVGHRFLGKEPFQVKDFADYQQKLRTAYVVLDREERKQRIIEGATALAAAENCTVKPDIGLLEEVTGLVEWPVVLQGKIDTKFMHVPQEVLSVSMRSHQKYFSVLKANSELAPYFITVSNMESTDKGAKIIAGNERVLRARLSDAQFFWNQDCQKTQESRLPLLEKVVFHAKLGTILDKAHRIASVAAYISGYIAKGDAAQAARAALLCKTDLVSEMVLEFPELQGIMGGYYARKEHEPEAISAAISDHYRPLGPTDSCPDQAVSIAVALADKIDTLVGLFAIDEKPTGSKDPFALRRATLGCIRIILENNINIPLKPLLEKALASYPAVNADKSTKTIDEVLEFFADRLKASLKSQDIRHNLINAVFDGGSEDNLLRLVGRVTALQSFLDSESGKAILAAYKRATSIVRLEEKKDGVSYNDTPSAEKLHAAEEKTLFIQLEKITPSVQAAVKENQFVQAMTYLGAVESPINDFFDKVIVNADDSDIRCNRLRILSHIRSLLDGIANFEKIEN